VTLVELLNEIRTLAEGDQPDRLARINQLVSRRDAPAEFQVGRHYAAGLLGAAVEAGLDDLDPDIRRAAIDTTRLVFPRSSAAKLLRRMVKDMDLRVRSRARAAVAALGLEDVAPPDFRYQSSPHYRIGQWNPTGWSFGLFAHHRARNKKPKRPSRVDAQATYQLPPLASPEDVAGLVGVPLDQLDRLMRPGCEAGSGYVEFEIPKARGGTRRIAAPRAPLRKVQRIILRQILDRIPAHDACHGFVAGRSTVTNARPHQQAALVLKLDLKDFFPTVHYRRVRGLFEQLGYATPVAGVLAGLTTHRPRLADGRVLWPGVLPQGAPTSPALANLVCRRLDHRLTQLAGKYGAIYTRYADDLTFSFRTMPEVRVGRLLWWIDGICQQEGFVERPDKRRILRNKHQQRVTGLVVNAGVKVPRADRRRFRAILANCQRNGVAAEARGRPDFAAYLAGYAAYVAMVDPVLGQRWRDQVAALLGEADA